jgi:glycosyltransferase involved in cell wall biosynthesis
MTMRITFVLKHADMAGGVRVVATYARRLMLRGHEVVVMSAPWPDVPAGRKIKSLLRGRGWPASRPIRASHLDGTGVEHRIIDRTRPIAASDLPDADVVVATWWETAEWIASYPASKGAKAYLIQHYEAKAWGDSADPRIDSTYTLPLRKIVISKWLKELMEQKFGDGRVWHVPNSVDTELFNAAPRPKGDVPTVGLLYAAIPFKGVDVSLAALGAARAELSGLRLISFGTEPPVAALPLPPGSEFILRPAQEKLREIYARCDLWLCGSRSEGFHLPPLEAMACRCPVVSTRVGGPMDIVRDGINGYLVDVGDHRALADRLVRVLRLPDEQWQKMSLAAWETASSYTWDDATDLLENALMDAAGRTPPGAAAPESSRLTPSPPAGR